MKYCLLTRNDAGKVTSISEAMSKSECEDRKDLYVETGEDEESMEIVPNDVARRHKSRMTSSPVRTREAF